MIHANGESFYFVSKHPKDNIAEMYMKHLRKDGYIVRIVPYKEYFYIYKSKNRKSTMHNRWKKKLEVTS